MFGNISNFFRANLPQVPPGKFSNKEEASNEQLDKDLHQFINKEAVFNELMEYRTYNGHRIFEAKSAEEKYQLALKYIDCQDAYVDLKDSNAGGPEYLSNQYDRCMGLRRLLAIATSEIKQ